MRTRIGVGIVAVVLVLYIALVAQRAVLLVASGDPVGIAMGIALVLLPVVAVWALWLEPTSLRVVAYRWDLPRWPVACSGLRVAVGTR